MKMRTQKTITFLFLLSFLFAQLSVSAVPSFLSDGILDILSYFHIPTPSLPTSSAELNRLEKSFVDKSLILKMAKSGKTGLKFLNRTINELKKTGYLNDASEDDVKSAITYVQTNYNIAVTGMLDQTTYDILSKPRCNVPDIINGTNTMTKFVNKPMSFKPWWNNDKKNNLTYIFAFANKVPLIVKSLFKDAFNRWSNVTRLNFTETTSFKDFDIVIGFVKFDGNGGMVAGSKIVIYNGTNLGIVFLDREEQWTSSNANAMKEGNVDMESVVMHQIGHLLGLEHSSVEDAIMYPIVLPKKKIELVNVDDLQKIQQIYGVNKSSSNLVESSANHQHSTTLTIVLVLGLIYGLLVTMKL